MGGQRIAVELFAKTQVTLSACVLNFGCDYSPQDRVFLNGYQTWTESREFRVDEKIPRLNPLAKPVLNHYQMAKYGDYLFFPNKAKKGYLHSYTYSYIRNGETFNLIGSLGEKNGFTIFQHITPKNTLQVIKDCTGLELAGSYKAFDLLQCNGAESVVFDRYFEEMNVAPPSGRDFIGWTSWYNYYTTITREIILENLQAFASRKIPLDIFQIDDGYQLAVGDWLITNEKFPGGMKPIADQIKSSGYRAGLWLAPFICEQKSRLFTDHPEWVLKDENNTPVVAGFVPNWSGKFYALDIYHPEFRQYLKTVFDTVLIEWGFDMVKLDFLYGAAMLHRKDKTRGQVMCDGMELIRELAGEKIVLGCGVPLGAAFGLVDYCRIGCDIALKWEDKLLKHVLRYRERVSTRSALDTAIGRRHLNYRAFINDPDVFLLRTSNIDLSADQKKTLFIVNLILGGLLFTSDNINEYSPEIMQLYLSQFPLRERIVLSVVESDDTFTINFRSSSTHYVACCNFSDAPRQVVLPQGDYFSEGRVVRGALALAPFQTRCLRRLSVDSVEVVCTGAHLFPGMDVEDSVVGAESITLTPHQAAVGRAKSGAVYISIPATRSSFVVNGSTHQVQLIDGCQFVVV